MKDKGDSLLSIIIHQIIAIFLNKSTLMKLNRGFKS